MAIKKNHPLYAEYIKKCEALREEHEKQAKRAQGAHCFDGAFNKLFQEQRKELKALQKEYSFLFEEE